jgi:hypothetical protein
MWWIEQDGKQVNKMHARHSPNEHVAVPVGLVGGFGRRHVLQKALGLGRGADGLHAQELDEGGDHHVVVQHLQGLGCLYMEARCGEEG